ncbi:hypothetical protein [Cryobacterium sp.]|uniref:hypothetical protein n=1 Tax=Cryobacterium sp. TaxID=1926290 RepID=UPI002629372E|nr:hypothetical protein [Cryobacterium sp.]MCU1447082.1 hypothetical protein [Cryobacterium sp.]
MTDKHPHDRGSGRPEFDSRRSAEIRSLLVRTVAGTPRPRPARLSRTAFSLAATAALLFAGGIGAGTVVAYDRLAGSTVAEDASAPSDEARSTPESLSAEGADAAAADDSESDSSESGGSELHGSELHGTPSAADSFTPKSDGLTPVLAVNGVTGYAYRSDLEAARLALLGVTADSADGGASGAVGGGVPIYRADGVTLLGYFDPAGLTP